MLKYTEFKKGILEGQEFPIYLFEGEDAYFRERGLVLLKKEFISEPELNTAVFSEEDGLEEILSSLNNYPLMSRKRLTVVREFYPKQEAFKRGFKEYLENPFPQSLLVILNEKPCEALKKYTSVTVVDCKKADASLLVKWVFAECVRYGVEIEREACSLIIQYCLSDMTRIDTETHKLIDYAGEGGKLTTLDVELMVHKDSDYKIYEMTDYIAKKNFRLAISVINEMLGKGESEQRILSSIYNHFRKLLHAGISGKTALQLAESLAIKEFPAKKLIEQSSKFKKRALKKAVDRLAEADFSVKTGKTDINEQLYLTVFSIMIEN